MQEMVRDLNARDASWEEASFAWGHTDIWSQMQN